MSVRGAGQGSLVAVSVVGLCLLAAAHRVGGTANPNEPSASPPSALASPAADAREGRPGPAGAATLTTAAPAAAANTPSETGVGSWIGQASSPVGALAVGPGPGASTPLAPPVAFADAAAPRPAVEPVVEAPTTGVSDLTGLALLMGGALALAGWRRARR